MCTNHILLNTVQNVLCSCQVVAVTGGSAGSSAHALRDRFVQQRAQKGETDQFSVETRIRYKFRLDSAGLPQRAAQTLSLKASCNVPPRGQKR
jgi:hypothetical protein